MTLVGGVCPTTLKFARYLHRTHRVYPKDLWQTQIMTLGSVAGINTKYQPALNAPTFAASAATAGTLLYATPGTSL